MPITGYILVTFLIRRMPSDTSTLWISPYIQKREINNISFPNLSFPGGIPRKINLLLTCSATLIDSDRFSVLPIPNRMLPFRLNLTDSSAGYYQDGEPVLSPIFRFRDES